jgi:transcriptional regulator with XRE-family HTH domain
MALTRSEINELRSTVVPSGNRVKAAIKLSRRTQGEIAAELGFTQSYLSNVARGHFATITVENARKLADFFGVAIEDLFPARQEVA